MANLNGRGQSRGVVLGAMAVLTAALVLGIKFFMSDDTTSTQAPPPGQGQIFNTQAAEKPPEGLRAPVGPVSGSGSGLEMFSKTNAGYYGEEASTAAAAGQGAGPEVKKSTAAVTKRGAAEAKPKVKATVIPRMKMGSLGGVTPSNVAPGGQGQMPDMSGIMKQVQQRTGQGNTSGD
ncbi:MAG: hypothetical protein HY952_04885 [Elusimicrobia bacterium]|nr:hypothetical protein [Elusimicrobiota bacterium]